MSDLRHELGKEGEKLARDFLVKAGFEILHQNFKTKFGELDIIAREKDTLVFVEVRTRRDTIFGNPLESINYRKQGKIVRMAKIFLSQNPDSSHVPCRFDVIGIVLNPTQETQIVHIRDAFLA